MTKEEKVISAFWKVFERADKDCIDISSFLGNRTITVYKDKNCDILLGGLKKNYYTKTVKKFFHSKKVKVFYIEVTVRDTEKYMTHSITTEDQSMIDRFDAIIEQDRDKRAAEREAKVEESLDRLLK